MSRHSNIQHHAQKQDHPQRPAASATRTQLVSQEAQSRASYVVTLLVVVMLAATGVVAAGSESTGSSLPNRTSAPSITGDPVEGRTLTTDGGVWSGPAPALGYQWVRCDSAGEDCSAIERATRNEYQLAGADVGSTIRVAVVATSKNGSTVATSDATPVVAGGSGGAAVASEAGMQLVVSTNDRRSDAAPLEGATISGNVYVFTARDAGTAPVRFFLDEEPDGTPYRVENNAPYDFAGGSADLANPWNTGAVSSGRHRIVAVDAAGQRAEASFSVGAAGVPSAPPAGAPQPATPPAATPVPQVAPPAGLRLVYSESNRRSAPASLDGKLVGGTIYVFTADDAATRAPVRFFLDEDPDGTPYRVERNAPFDFAGGSADLANGWNTSGLPSGRHRIVAIDAAGSRAEASFAVGEADVPEPPAPRLQLAISTSGRRTDAGLLNGATVRGSVYVFTATSPDTRAPVRFFLDEEPDATPYRVENSAPFDFAGGSADLANAWNTGAVPTGQHRIVALDATGLRAEATFTVADEAQSPPTPSGSGTVHYRQNWEHPDDDGIDSQQWGMQCDNIAGEPVATRGTVTKSGPGSQGRFAGRFTLPPNVGRATSACELMHGRQLDHGTHDYYSLALMFPSDWREPALAHWGMAVFQPNYQGIKGPGVGLFAHADHVNLATESGFCDGAGCTYRTGNGAASGPLGTHYAIPRGRFAKNVWHELVMHVFWTSDPSKGVIEVWHRRKGESQWVRTAHLTNLATVQWRAGYDPTGNHWTNDKIGAYRGNADWSISLYHDAWSRATSFEAAATAFS